MNTNEKTPSKSNTIITITRWVFILNALINWIVSPAGIINPTYAATVRFAGPEPIYPSIIRLWLGLVFMFGIMFWEVGQDVEGKAALIKYNWIEKTITASAITYGYFVLGDIPTRLMTTIVFTNWLWIPIIIWSDVQVHKWLKFKAGPAGTR